MKGGPGGLASVRPLRGRCQVVSINGALMAGGDLRGLLGKELTAVP